LENIAIFSKISDIGDTYQANLDLAIIEPDETHFGYRPRLTG